MKSLMTWIQLHWRYKELKITLVDARTLFDTLLDDYPDMSLILATNAKIMGDSIFEGVICKILSMKGDIMNDTTIG